MGAMVSGRWTKSMWGTLVVVWTYAWTCASMCACGNVKLPRAGEMDICARELRVNRHIFAEAGRNEPRSPTTTNFGRDCQCGVSIFGRKYPRHFCRF